MWRNWQKWRAHTHCAQSKELKPPYPSPARQNTFLYLELIQVYICLFYFWKVNFTQISHHCHNYSMFRDVPECSGMFHVRILSTAQKSDRFDNLHDMVWRKMPIEKIDLYFSGSISVRNPPKLIHLCAAIKRRWWKNSYFGMLYDDPFSE